MSRTTSAAKDRWDCGFKIWVLRALIVSDDYVYETAGRV
jgi:hypothetical protein